MASALDPRSDVGHDGVGPLAFALAASIAFHVLVLWFAAGLKAGLAPQDSLPLAARLVTVRPPPAALSASAVPPTARPAPNPTVRAAPVKPKPLVRPAPLLAITQPTTQASLPPANQAEPAPPPVVAPPSATLPAALPTAQSAQVARIAPRTTDSAHSAPAEVSDSTWIAQYRSGLIATAQRYRKYPLRAIENNWEGRADVRLAIAANGAVDSISLLTRSGYEVLDRQALQMIRKAGHEAPMPPALRGKAFMLDIPVMFNLKDEAG